ncbi:hypothetical protein SUGI_0292690 [Cryptomeria japonica]|nr:hypothetical protein SUGI_0292690 [Cryptomeria japonica]
MDLMLLLDSMDCRDVSIDLEEHLGARYIQYKYTESLYRRREMQSQLGNEVTTKAKPWPPHCGYSSSGIEDCLPASWDQRPLTDILGCVAVRVGVEQTKFMIAISYLNHPLFANLLEDAEEVFGFEQNGCLRIPCTVHKFLLTESMGQFSDLEFSF